MKDNTTPESLIPKNIHELKIWKEYFDDVDSGRKSFEVRKLDRLFGVGDTLWLREWGNISGYTGRETRKIITYLMVGGQWGLSQENCIMGLAPESLSGETVLKDSMKEKAIEIVTELAEWSKKYPRGRIYPMSKMNMDDELIAIEIKAKQYLESLKNNL